MLPGTKSIVLLVELGGVNMNDAGYDLRTAVHFKAGINQYPVLTYFLQVCLEKINSFY